ncbi:MAG: ribulose-phosphate 3-epimerase [Prevotellaceae bacterium]|nr:ribulose-phosphate 3-epimerase [Prevotellaceae bacterium]
MNGIISPSILSADFGNLQKCIELLNKSSAEWIHLDVMDGVFVPNISFGLPVVEAIARLTVKPLDVHLMIVSPEKYVEAFARAGANILTIHWEACTYHHNMIQHIKTLGLKVGISINPATPVMLLENIIADIDLLLVMSVNPGFGGQKFIPETMNKIRQAKELILRKGSTALIEVDGGVSIDNAGEIFAAGGDVLVLGNAIFSANDPIAYIENLKSLKQ